MSKSFKVHVIFPTEAETASHAEFRIENYINGKGIRKDGVMPIYYEITSEEA